MKDIKQNIKNGGNSALLCSFLASFFTSFFGKYGYAIFHSLIPFTVGYSLSVKNKTKNSKDVNADILEISFWFLIFSIGFSMIFMTFFGAGNLMDVYFPIIMDFLILAPFFFSLGILAGTRRNIGALIFSLTLIAILIYFILLNVGKKQFYLSMRLFCLYNVFLILYYPINRPK